MSSSIPYCSECGHIYFGDDPTEKWRCCPDPLIHHLPVKVAGQARDGFIARDIAETHPFCPIGHAMEHYAKP